MATPDQVAVVAACHQTFSDRDVDGFITHLAENAVLRPSTLIAGGEEYRGAEDVRAGFNEIAKLLEARGEDVAVEPLHFYVDRANDDRIASQALVTLTRASDAPFATEILYLWTMDGEKVAELSASLDVGAGMKQLGDPEEVEPPA
jgi:ketosteroid isomerase-like protein